MSAGAPQDAAARHELVARLGERPPQRWRRGLVGPDDDDGDIEGVTARTASERHQHRSRASRTLHHLYEASSHALTGTVVTAVVLGWVVVGIVTRFPGWWQTVLYSTSGAVTLIMVFAIQHTQTRQQTAMQRKLDELLRTQPSADDHIIAAEEGTDEELQALADLNWNDREAAE